MHAPTEFSTPVDVYGFGMLLFELNTRLLPFPELQWQQIMMAVALHGTRPDIPGTWPRVRRPFVHHWPEQ